MFDMDMLQDAINNGYFLGNGAAREVFEVSDKLVVKIPMPGGNVQSWQEIDFHDEYFENYSEFMAEIHGWMIKDGVPIIFMERVTPLNECIQEYIEHNNLDPELLNDIYRFEEETGLEDSSSNGCNWGIRKSTGELVAMDFGISEEQPLAND